MSDHIADYVPEAVINKYGFRDFEFLDCPNMPVCSHCHGFKFPNRGQGTLCTSCADQALREYEHDVQI